MNAGQCKVLAHFTASANDSPCLEIPSSSFEEHSVSDALILQGRNGAQYTAKWVKISGKIYVLQGWAEFKEDQDIEGGDILLCKLYEGSRLWIAIADKNAENSKGSNIKTHCKQGHEKKTTIEKIKAAKSTMKKPSCVLQLSKHMVSSHKCGVSKEFAEKVGAKNGEAVKLQVSGCSKADVIRWLYCPKSGRFKGFGAGWSAFARMHEVRGGDFLLLELTHPKLITAHIFRAETEAEEESCTCGRPHPSPLW